MMEITSDPEKRSNQCTRLHPPGLLLRGLC